MELVGVSKKVQELIANFSEVPDRNELKGYKTVRVYMTLKEWAKIKPFLGQKYHDGTPVINESQVKYLMDNYDDVLNQMPLNPPILNSKGEAIKRIHTGEATRRILKDRPEIGDYKIPVDLIVDKTTMKQDSHNAVVDNFGSNTQNGTQQVMRGESLAAENLFWPVQRAFALAGATEGEEYPPGVFANLVLRIASYFNKNEDAIDTLAKTGRLAVTAIKLYDLKGAKTLNIKKFLTIKDEDVRVNLNGKEEILAIVLANAIQLTKQLKKTKSKTLDPNDETRYLTQWEKIFGGIKMAHYYILALTFNGRIVPLNGRFKRKDQNVIDFRQFGEIGQASPDVRAWVKQLNVTAQREGCISSLNDTFFPKRTITIGS